GRAWGRLPGELLAARPANPGVRGMPALGGAEAVPATPLPGDVRFSPELDWRLDEDDSTDPAAPALPSPEHVTTRRYGEPISEPPPEALPVRHDNPPPLESLPAWLRISKAASRNEAFESLCELAGRRPQDAAVFTIHGPTAVLRVAAGLDGPESTRELPVPLESAAAFRTAVQTGSPYLGPVDDASRQVLALLGRAPAQALFLPIKVVGRVVALLYGDHGQRPPRSDDVGDLVVATGETGRAFHTLILRSKRGTFAAAHEPAEAG